ncbi:acyltransferase family protein [Acetobacter suratthaniensis]|uniref:Acyltransferase family protein n=1 Tax=Acetobacter suratthaniensis TaxID=1502841 RepID=A0ABS3LQ27_9PROT|nr:acyltransferase family protein [Acetobacter suratthaniensis]
MDYILRASGVFSDILTAFNFWTKKNRLFFYFISLLLTIDTQYSFFIFGLIMSDLYSSGYIHTINKPYTSILAISFSLFISSYPIPYAMEGIYVGGIYKYITFTKIWDLNYGTYLRIGVFTFFITLLRFSYLQKTLENRQIMFLGKISFPLYLIHYMIAQSIDFQFGHVGSLYIAAAETVSVLVISIAISIPFEIYIDRKGIEISNKIALRLLGFSPFKKAEI